MRRIGYAVLSLSMVFAVAGCESFNEKSITSYWQEFVEFTKLELAFGAPPAAPSELALTAIRVDVGDADQAETLEDWRMRAAGGDAEAQFGLGLAYHLGLGVAPDYGEAHRWYAMAAQRGDIRAVHNIGIMLGTGQGVPPNYMHAYKWFSVATEKLPPGLDHHRAVTNREIMAKELPPADISEAHRLAREWQPEDVSFVELEAGADGVKIQE